MALVGNGVPSEVHLNGVTTNDCVFLPKLLLDQLLLGLAQLNDLHRRSLQTYVFGISGTALVSQLILIFRLSRCIIWSCIINDLDF